MGLGAENQPGQHRGHRPRHPHSWTAAKWETPGLQPKSPREARAGCRRGGGRLCRAKGLLPSSGTSGLQTTLASPLATARALRGPPPPAGLALGALCGAAGGAGGTLTIGVLYLWLTTSLISGTTTGRARDKTREFNTSEQWRHAPPGGGARHRAPFPSGPHPAPARGHRPRRPEVRSGPWLYGCGSTRGQRPSRAQAGLCPAGRHSSPGPRGPRRVRPAFGQKSSFLACASPCWDPRALSPLPSPTLRSRQQMPCAPSPDTEAPEAG